MMFRSGFISVVGRPNTGKSTLVNNITGQKVSIVSPKPQTTRNTVRGILTEEGHQMVFMDTPGIHRPKNKLGEYMVNSAVSSLSGVELVLLVTEPGYGGVIGEDDREIIHRLKDRHERTICVVNKCDMYEEKHIIRSIKTLSGLAPFHSILPISAFTGKNMDILKGLILELLPEGPMYFDQNQYTDQPEKNLAGEFIREKMLLFLREEIPHGTGVEVLSFQERETTGIIDIQANIYCEKKSHKGIIIGEKGEMLKKIGTHARRDIENLLDAKVYLTLWVKVREGWRNNKRDMRMMGYD
ncbi:MAG: GTPase Era [Clostridia bacterium]